MSAVEAGPDVGGLRRRNCRALAFSRALGEPVFEGPQPLRITEADPAWMQGASAGSLSGEQAARLPGARVPRVPWPGPPTARSPLCASPAFCRCSPGFCRRSPGDVSAFCRRSCADVPAFCRRSRADVPAFCRRFSVLSPVLVPSLPRELLGWRVPRHPPHKTPRSPRESIGFRFLLDFFCGEIQ